MDTGFMDRLLLAQTTIDYDVDRRSEEGLIGRLLASDHTRVVIVDNGLVAVPKRFGSVTPAAPLSFAFRNKVLFMCRNPL